MNIQEIRQRFYGFRNGIVAKALRDAGMDYKMIFGLQLPQIAEIAREAGYDHELAKELWKETDCREARLIACYLLDPGTLTEKEAEVMASEVKTREEADILSWRLLCRLPYARELLPKLDGYIAEALKRNLDPI